MLSKKYFLAAELNFSTPLVASRARQCDGPHRITRERSQSFVHVLQRLAAAEAAKNRLSRDFGSCSIFDFFDRIDHLEKLATGNTDGMRYWQMGNTFLNDYSADSKIRWFALQPTNSSWHSAATPILFHADEVIG